MSLYTGSDLFLCPIRVVAGANAIRVQNSGTLKTLIIPPGTYYMGQSLPSGFASLPDAIVTAWNAFPESATFQALPRTPSGGSSRLWWGFGLTRLTGTGGWGIYPADALTTFPVTALLGYTVNTITTGSNITPQRVRGGCWFSYRRADRKLTNVSLEQTVNGGRGDVLQVTRWGTDKVRLFEYSQIPAGHVREGRSDASYAGIAQMSTGDRNNKFQALWTAGIASHEKVLCAHNVGDADDNWYIKDHDYEVLQSLPTSEYAKDLNSCISRESRNAEYYRIAFGMRVLTGTYGEG